MNSNQPFGIHENYNFIMKIKQEMNGTQMMRDGGIERPNTSTPLKPEYNYMPSSSEDNSDMNHHDDLSQKGTRFLGTKAVSILNKWFHENRDYPYPDDATTDFLASQAEISAKQVKKWFANKRVRSQLCCKPMNRNKKKLQNSSIVDDRAYNNNNQNNNPNLLVPVNEVFKRETKPNFNSQQQKSKRNQQNSNNFLPPLQQNYHQSSLPKSLPNMLPGFLQHQQAFMNQNPSLNTLNNSLLLRSMSYLNPMIMMNILSSGAHLQNNNTTNPPSLQWIQHQALMNLANQKNIIQEHQFQQKENQSNFHLISEKMIASSVSSSSSDDQINDSISNEYQVDEVEEDVNEEEIKDENSIYAESYENSNVSESMSKENKQNEDIENDVDTYGYDSTASHHSMNNKNYRINNEQKFKNGKKKRFENSTGESSGTSSWSNYTDHSNSLINLNSSPASSSSASSSSNNTPSNNNTDNSRLNYLSSQKTNIEKKINFAIISTLVD